MNDVMEMLFVRQMSGLTGGDSWVQAVFLAGVFLVILYRREQIVSPYMFRVSIILFVLSSILPVVFTALLQTGSFGRGRGMMDSPEGGALFRMILLAIGPTLFGLSVLLCILSMLPAQSRYPAPREPSQPHPLD